MDKSLDEMIRYLHSFNPGPLFVARSYIEQAKKSTMNRCHRVKSNTRRPTPVPSTSYRGCSTSSCWPRPGAQLPCPWPRQLARWPCPLLGRQPRLLDPWPLRWSRERLALRSRRLALWVLVSSCCVWMLVRGPYDSTMFEAEVGEPWASGDECRDGKA
jgi:hypothetical protein